jgi:hypothetical protein
MKKYFFQRSSVSSFWTHQARYTSCDRGGLNTNPSFGWVPRCCLTFGSLSPFLAATTECFFEAPDYYPSNDGNLKEGNCELAEGGPKVVPTKCEKFPHRFGGDNSPQHQRKNGGVNGTVNGTEQEVEDCGHGCIVIYFWKINCFVFSAHLCRRLIRQDHILRQDSQFHRLVGSNSL